MASLLIPFPHAVDDHQTRNAGFLSLVGAATLLPQEQLTPEAVSEFCLTPPSVLQEMAARARALARPEAASEVARMCEEFAK